MKFLKSIFATALAFSVTAASASGLTISNGQYMHNGYAFNGVGVNYFNAFYRYAMNGNDTSWKAGLATLHGYNVPFIRINTLGFWPTDLRADYFNNKTVFYQRLDAFMQEAANQNIGVVMDVFWNWSAFADLNGEHMQAWGDASSKTRQTMRAVTTEIVSRYKNHPALWGWEFANESASLMDLPNGNHQWLPVSGSQGTPSPRTAVDDFTVATILSAQADFAATVRALDPDTPIFSGNSAPRYDAWHLQTGSWTADTVTQFGLILSRDNPAPAQAAAVNTLGLHLYPSYVSQYFGSASTTLADLLSATMTQSHKDGRPVFLGEFGVSDQDFPGAAGQTKFAELTQAILVNRVPMSALWVFDLTQQNGSWNTTATNSRAWQLDSVRNMNAIMKTW